MKRLVSLLTVFCLCLALITPSKVEAATLKLNKSKANMELDSTLKLKLGSLSGAESKWATSNKKVATVSKEGVITAKSEGTSNITATNNGTKYTCKVTVVDSNKSIADNSNAGKLSDYVKVVKEYRWSTDYSNYIGLVVKNTSSSTVEATISLKLLDENGKSVGAKNDGEYAIGKGQEVLLVFMNDDSFSTYEYNLSVKKDSYYSSVVDQLAINTETTEDKAIIEITNNGNVPALFVEYSILYFLNDQVVDYGWGYCVDNDSEIKPGNTEIDEDHVYTEFDSIKVYVTGRASK